MFAKISKYGFEIIAGIAIFVAIVYFLPSNKVEIPDIGELALSGVDLEFVMDDAQSGAVDTLSGTIQTGAIEQAIVAVDTGVVATGIVDTGVIAFEPVEEPIVVEPTPTEILPIVISGKDPEPTPTTAPISVSQQSCMIPRGGTIKDGASVLAYQQRSDDPATCNIQRRTCTNGTLNGSYTQPSCKEVIGYSNVQEEKVVAYNVPNNSDPYIQPTSTSTSNIASNNTNKTYNRFTPSVSPSGGGAGGGGSIAGSALRNNNSNPLVTNTSSSTVRDGTVCQTPWGEEVRNGQFVKAYRFDKGFSNLPCEVELRYCVQTNLEGSFAYQSCQPYDIAVEDYMVGHYDPNVPSLQQLAEVLHGSADDIPADYGQKPGLWERLKGFVTGIFK